MQPHGAPAICTRRLLDPARDSGRRAGAYGAGMASSYNTRALIPEVMIRGKDFSVIRRRMEVDELINLEILPVWLSNNPG